MKKFFDNIKDENRVIQLTDKNYLKSLEINEWYGNSINYGDCTIINTMMNMKIKQIVSFDEDFKKIKVLNVISNV